MLTYCIDVCVFTTKMQPSRLTQQHCVVSIPSTTTTICSLTAGFSGAAVVDLDSLQTPPPLRVAAAALSHQLVGEWEGGEGSEKGWFTQGSRLPLLVPSLLIPDSFPQAHDLSQPLNPSRSRVGLWLQSHLSLHCSFFFFLIMIV